MLKLAKFKSNSVTADPQSVPMHVFLKKIYLHFFVMHVSSVRFLTTELLNRCECPLGFSSTHSFNKTEHTVQLISVPGCDPVEAPLRAVQFLSGRLNQSFISLGRRLSNLIKACALSARVNHSRKQDRASFR